MQFASPGLLWLLTLAPLLVAVYVWILSRMRRTRFPNVAIVRTAIAPGRRWRRHVPPALLLAALAVLVVAMARPSASVVLPMQFKTVVLAMDTSGSMRAADVEPNRITAAQNAAKGFVRDVPKDVRIGIVEFGATASAVQTPTGNRHDLVAAIDRFILQRGTATGSGLYLALAMLFPEAGIDIERLVGGSGAPATAGRAGGGPGSAGEPGSRGGRDRALGARPGPDRPPEVAVEPGSYDAGVVILLSDGRRTTGPDPIEAARWAARRGVRVYTVGFGSKSGAAVDFGEYAYYMRPDEETLRAVAEITRGQYFHAGTATDLGLIYEDLRNRLVLERRNTEVGALFSGLGAGLAVIAGTLSLLWFGRST